MSESNRRWAHIRKAVNLAVLLSMLALTVSLIGTVVSLRNDAEIEKATVASVDEIRSSEMASCARVQGLRNQSNAAARVIYVTLTTVTAAARQRGSGAAGQRVHAVLRRPRAVGDVHPADRLSARDPATAQVYAARADPVRRLREPAATGLLRVQAVGHMP